MIVRAYLVGAQTRPLVTTALPTFSIMAVVFTQIWKVAVTDSCAKEKKLGRGVSVNRWKIRISSVIELCSANIAETSSNDCHIDRNTIDLRV